VRWRNHVEIDEAVSDAEASAVRASPRSGQSAQRVVRLDGCQATAAAPDTRHAIHKMLADAAS
jgi:uncharacterized metal-binding protein